MERAQTYLEKMEKILTTSSLKTAENYGVPFFANGNALTVYCCLREVCNIIRETEITYGFLPAPKLDENQKEYKTVVTDVLWGIPAIHNAKLEMIGAVTEALSCQHYNYVRPAFYETTMKGKLSDSPNDVAMLDLIPATRCLDFSYAYNSVLKPMSTLKDLTNTTTSSNLASTYQSLAGTLEMQLKTLVETIEKLPG